jgi:hypothetical protein
MGGSPRLSLVNRCHWASSCQLPFEAGLELAAGIPGARFVPLEGDTQFFYFCDMRKSNLRIARAAEAAGFDFLFPIAKWRGHPFLAW